MIKKILLFFLKYLLIFGLASFIGWLYEMICVRIIYGQFYDRGILRIPICPIYGFGILVLIFIFQKIKNPFLLFVGSVFVTTVVELVTSYVLEYKFNLILWTYDGWPLSFQDRISAVSSCIFGLMAVIFIKLIKPPVDKVFGSKYKTTAALSVILLFVISIAGELWMRHS